jgi:TonB dependent receptor
VNELPLNGRNPLNLIGLVPSVVPQGQTMSTPTGQNQFAFGNYQIGGGMANQSAAFLDGAPLNSGYSNIVTLVPIQDSIQEFKVQTNNLTPEFGRFAGGVVNLSTKAGTNEAHGGATEFFRNKVLNGNDFFNNSSGVPTPSFPQTSMVCILEGRCIFPEELQLHQGKAYTLSVPPLAQRTGDFSNLRNAAGNLLTVYDPLTTVADPNRAGFYTRQPFSGNIIPASRFDQTAVKMMPLLFRPPNLAGSPFTEINNWADNASIGGENAQTVVRIDHNLSDKQHLFGRYTYWGDTSLPYDPYRNGLCQDRCTEFIHNNSAVIDDVYTLTPTTILDLRISYLRFAFDRTPINLGFDLRKIGWSDALNNDVLFRVLPVPSFTGFDTFGNSGSGSVIIARADNSRVAGSLTKIAGSHSLKFGGEFLRLTYNFGQTQTASGSFNFDPNYTASDPLHPSGGSSIASFLLGFPSSGGAVTPTLVAGQQLYSGLFLQDDWKITRRLTINGGMRWEKSGPWSERFDRLSYFQRDVPNPILKQAGLNYLGAMGLVASSDRPSRNNLNSNLHQFGPRLGIAYQLNSKTVIRSGWGLFWLPNDVVYSALPSQDQINGISTPSWLPWTADLHHLDG